MGVLYSEDPTFFSPIVRAILQLRPGDVVAVFPTGSRGAGPRVRGLWPRLVRLATLWLIWEPAGFVAELRRCEALDVEHEPAALKLVEVLAARGRLDEALNTCLAHLRIARSKAEFYLAAARIHVARKETDRAVGVLRKGLRQTRDRRIEAMLVELLGAGPDGEPDGLPEQPGQSGGVPRQVETPAD